MQQDNQNLNTPAQQQSISDDQVTSYLRSHPHFFEDVYKRQFNTHANNNFMWRLLF